MKNFFDFSNLKGDLLGGITAGIVALPLALAFGVSSGLGPGAGLYGAILLGFFASLLGGTPTQISGPTAPVTAVSMVVIAGIMASNDGNLSRALPAILTVFLMAGLIQILMGVSGTGKYIKYISYPVISGFMTAIGLIIILTQLLPILGYYPKEDTALVTRYETEAQQVVLQKIIADASSNKNISLQSLQQATEKANHLTPTDITKEAQTLAAQNASGVVGSLKTLPHAIRQINWLEFFLAISTIAIIYGFKRITKLVPSTLVALVVVSLVAYFGGFPYRAIEQIPQGFPVPQWALFTSLDLGIVSPYIFTAFTIALLGSIDTLLTSVVADNLTKTKHKPNQELIAQGIGNSLAALFGGIPGAGATIRTVVNINSGAKTKLSGMAAALLLLVVMLSLAPIASKIPAAVLAGILFTVGLGVIDYKGLRAIPAMPKDMKVGPVKISSEVVILLVVMLLSTFWNLVYAVGIGLIIAALIFMKKMGDFTASSSSVKTIANIPTAAQRADEHELTEELQERVAVKKLNGPLFFGVIDEVKTMAQNIPTGAQYLVVRMDNVPYLDQSGAYALEDIFLEMEIKGIEVLLVNLQAQPSYLLHNIKLIPQLIESSNIFKSFDECLLWIKTQTEAKA